MERGYRAFGLTLRSSFPIPLPELGTDGVDPWIEMPLVRPAELERSWSGAASPQPWRGRLGDGHELTIEWGREGDLRFDYGGGARFRLNAERTRIECAPDEADDLAWQRLLLGRVLPNVSLAFGREGLHAAALETAAGVVAIAAPAGTGKSTLAVELMRRGARLFADDFLVLDRDAEGVCAHPGGPHLNITGDAADHFERDGMGTVLACFPGERWAQADAASTRARPVAAIVLLRRAPGLALSAEVVAPSPLALASYMLGLPDDEAGREAKRFALYADLVESTMILSLTADAADPPALIADALERVLPPAAAPSALEEVA